MLAAIGNYNLLEVKGMREIYTNGHEYFKDNAKNAVMQVYHGETIENENKPHKEADHKNAAIVQKIIMWLFLTLPVSK